MQGTQKHCKQKNATLGAFFLPTSQIFMGGQPELLPRKVQLNCSFLRNEVEWEHSPPDGNQFPHFCFPQFRGKMLFHDNSIGNRNHRKGWREHPIHPGTFHFVPVAGRGVRRYLPHPVSYTHLTLPTID